MAVEVSTPIVNRNSLVARSRPTFQFTVLDCDENPLTVTQVAFVYEFEGQSPITRLTTDGVTIGGADTNVVSYTFAADELLPSTFVAGKSSIRWQWYVVAGGLEQVTIAKERTIHEAMADPVYA